MIWNYEFKIQQKLERASARKALTFLKQSDYSVEALSAVLGNNPARALNAHEYEMALERTKDSTALSALIRLFLLKNPLSHTTAQRALGKKGLQALTSAGLLNQKAGTIAPAYKLTPIQDWILASDFQSFEGRREKVRPDYVMGIGASTRFLASFMVRRPVEQTLDLGTGCGTLAFLASHHSQRVALTDYNRRAVQVSAYNAWLNGVDTFDYYEGDMFKPVAGKKFGLIVSSPPYVISPETRYLFRDGDGGNNLCRRLVEGAPSHLEEGGFCQFLCNWPHHGDDGVSYLKSWFKNIGCDVWVLRCFTQDVAEYGAEWLRHTEPDSLRDVSTHYKRWMEFYKKEGISKISGAIITMRRQTGKNWLQIDDNAPSTGQACGEQTALLMENRALLQQCSQQELLAQRWQWQPHVAITHTGMPGNGAHDGELFWAQGLGKRVPCSQALLKRLDGAVRAKKSSTLAALAGGNSKIANELLELARWGMLKIIYLTKYK